MAREQLGICAEANLHGNYLLCTVLDGQEAVMRYKLPRILQLVERLSELFSEAMLTAVVGISHHYWDNLYPWHRPENFQACPDLASEHVAVSYTMADLLIQVRSDRQDVNYIALQQIYQLIHGHVEVLEQLSGFRYLDGRQLTGFVDAPLNPRGQLKRKVALIDAKVCPTFAGGSYVFFYRWLLDHKIWSQLSTAQQEAIMGYAKLEAKTGLASGHENSHLGCWEAAHAEGALILQQNMAYATLQLQGAISLNFSADSSALTTYWQQRFAVHADRIADPLLDFCQLDLASAFFVPSLSFLEAAARGDFRAP